MNKPKVRFSGEDGNVFNLMGIATNALNRVGLKDEAKKMRDRVFESHGYDHAIQIMMEYVEVE